MPFFLIFSNKNNKLKLGITICDTQFSPEDVISPTCPAIYPGYLIGNAPLNLHTYALPCTAPAAGCGFQPPGDHTGADLFRALDTRICFSYPFKHVQQAVLDVLRAVDADK